MTNPKTLHLAASSNNNLEQYGEERDEPHVEDGLRTMT